MNLPLFDRNAELRDNDEQLILRLMSDSRILIAIKGQFIGSNNRPRYFSYQQLIEQQRLTADISNHLLQHFIYLGHAKENASKTGHKRIDYFVFVSSSRSSKLEKALSEDGQRDTQTTTSNQADDPLIDIRKAAMSGSPLDIGLLIYAKGLVYWHFRNQFCGSCGHPNQSTCAGHSRVCHNNACRQVHFPKIEPAVIFSIETQLAGTSQLLLARQPAWPEKRYSVVAGFSEIGETLEETVKRESLEEVGLALEKVEYVASQPWPFPASLMLAFKTETKQHEIRLLDKELEAADWYSAEKLKQAVENGELLLPFEFSVSWQLIDSWYKKETGQALRNLINKH